MVSVNSLSLEKGKIKTLIGINGGGKTTLARIIIGAIKASNGEIIKQKNIKIGHMPQKIQVDKTIPMTVIDFIKLVNDKGNVILVIVSKWVVKVSLFIFMPNF